MKFESETAIRNYHFSSNLRIIKKGKFCHKKRTLHDIHEAAGDDADQCVGILEGDSSSLGDENLYDMQASDTECLYTYTSSPSSIWHHHHHRF